MASSPSTRTKVFISYSHADKKWLERLKKHLKPVVRGGHLEYWDDTHIQPGDDWQREIRTALDTAQVAVLLISADFFSSDFIDETELPPLLTAAQTKGCAHPAGDPQRVPLHTGLKPGPLPGRQLARPAFGRDVAGRTGEDPRSARADHF